MQQFIKEQFWAILQFAYSPPDIVIHQIAFCFLIFFAISSYRTVQILVLKYLLYSKLLENTIHIYLSSRTEYYFNPGSSAGANWRGSGNFSFDNILKVCLKTHFNLNPVYYDRQLSGPGEWSGDSGWINSMKGFERPTLRWLGRPGHKNYDNY